MGKHSNMNPRVSQTCPLRYGQYKDTALCMCVRTCFCETSYVEGKNRVYMFSVDKLPERGKIAD